MAMEVWMHRRKGELWMTTSYLLRFRLADGSVLWLAASSSSLILSRSIEAILAPRFLVCSQPL
jgi:hypothetical protein